MDEEKNELSVDYAKLVAAQNEAGRRLKIATFTHDLTEEQKKKSLWGKVSGVCIAGIIASSYLTGFDYKEAVALEIQALTSLEALKDYLMMITPPMWLSILGSAGSIMKYKLHNDKLKEAQFNLDTINEFLPKNYLDEVEGQARGR